MKEYIVIFISTIIFDVIWIGYIASRKYRNALGHMLMLSENKISVRKLPTFGLYIILSLFIYLFAYPSYLTNSISISSIFASMTTGVLWYGFYELTNLAILKDWPKSIVIIDIIWGGILVTLSSSITYLILN